jgi:hypothetical protein
LKYRAFEFAVFKIFSEIPNSFEFQKFQTHYMKVLVKDKKVNISRTNKTKVLASDKKVYTAVA